MKKTHIPFGSPNKTYYFRVVSEAEFEHQFGYHKYYLLVDEEDEHHLRVASYVSHIGMWYLDTMSVETFLKRKYEADMKALRARLWSEVEAEIASRPGVVEVRPHVYEMR